MPDAMVLCHEAGREAVHGYESFPLADPGTLVSLYEDLARPVHTAEVVAGSLNTHHLDSDAAERELAAFADASGVPATDPVRFGVGEVLDAL
jgi:uncharacterized NAD-dependent epimerase/dehydratase family protein